MAAFDPNQLAEGDRTAKVVNDLGKREHALSLHHVSIDVNTARSDRIDTFRRMNKRTPLTSAQGKRLAAAREAAGYKSARSAAIENGWRESTYRSHENGTRTIGQDDAERYARRYMQLGSKFTATDILFPSVREGVSLMQIPLFDNLTHEEFTTEVKSATHFGGRKDLPVYASTEEGVGFIAMSREVVDLVDRPGFLTNAVEGFALLLSGTSMMPVYNPGDLLWINPKLPAKIGKSHFFIAQEDEGILHGFIALLLDITHAEWSLKRFSPPAEEPPEFRCLRQSYPRAYRILGKYEGE
jgi:phage repressor protein C with HTH and peptisase S24 domain